MSPTKMAIYISKIRYLFSNQIRVIINKKTISVNVSVIAFFKTASHTIHSFHINLQCRYFLTDQHLHFKQKFSLV